MSKQQVEAVIEMLGARASDESPTIEQQRAGMEQMAGAFPGPDTERKAETVGGVACEWQTPEGASDGAALLYLHGGGYCLGSIVTHRSLVGELAKTAGVRTLAADYRLAPEHPYPAALEDAVAVYSALLEQGCAPDKIAIGGDSAGGGLTMALLLAAKERGLPQPGCAILLSPWTDMTGSGDSHASRAGADPWIQRDGLLTMAGHYCGEIDPEDPLVSPVRADLSGLAPLLIHVGDAEVLLSDSTDLADRVRAAGGEAEIKIWDDMIHVFQAFFPLIEEGRESIAELGAFVGEKLA